MRSYIRKGPPMRVMQPLWQHSLATALIAETLGGIAGLSTTALYTAGLIHDAGRLGLLGTLGGQYAKMLRPPAITLEEANQLERESFGIDHTEAGAIVVEEGGLPRSLCKVIRHHHDNDDHGDETLQHIQIACRLASALGYHEHDGLISLRMSEVMVNLPASLRQHTSLQPQFLLNRISRVLQPLAGPR
jgi:HD-like signal output (HDOD) protein